MHWFKEKIEPKLNFYNTILVAYIGLWMLGYPLFKRMINVDTTSYLTIAQKYANGDFINAFNAYWSPMICWLLAPLLKMGVDPMLAFKVLNFVIGIGVLFQLKRLFDRVAIRKWLSLLVMGILITRILLWAYSPHPDLLLLFFALLLYNQISKENVFAFSNCILIGLIGALSFFAKTYFFGFFPLLMIVLGLAHYFFKNQKPLFLLQRIGLIFILFYAFASPWIFALSQKYGELTISSAGSYNHALVIREGTWLHPAINQGFLQPTNDTSISIWEDNGLTKYEDWSMFDSFALFKRQVTVVFLNVIRAIVLLNEANFFAFVTVLIGAILVFFRKELVNNQLKEEIVRILTFCALYLSGYLLILLNFRYILIMDALLLLLAALIVQFLFDKISFNALQKLIMIGLFSVAATALPVRDLAWSINDGKQTYELSMQIKELKLPEKANFASDQGWWEIMFVAYYLNYPYYGQVGSYYKTEEAIEKALKEKQIDYFFLIEPTKDYAFLSRYQEVTNGTIPNLRIYRIE